MPATTLHLTNTDNGGDRYAVEQGATLNWLTLILDGDYTSWTPRGQIRDNYASKGGNLIASFEFPPLQMGDVEVNGETISGTVIRPQLPSDVTGGLNWQLNPRTDSSQPAAPGVNVWVYDLEIESPIGEVIRLTQGFVEVSLETTT